MIKKIVGVFLVLVHFIITGCNSQSGTSDVEVVTGGIFEPVSFVVVGGSDLGTFSISNDPKLIEISITNNSKYPITSVDLVISKEVSAGIIFVPDEKGKSLFPGTGGTCGRSIPANSNCVILLQYKPSISGVFTQNLTFMYKNLVEQQTLDTSLTAIAGEPASLFFTSEKSNYSFGILERTDLIKKYETIEIKNGGGLPAENLNITLDQTVGQAYKITSHNCPKQLWMGASCNLTFEFLPRNYGPTAPDGEQEDLLYSAQIIFDYVRTPDGKLGLLNAYLSSLSTSIRGRMTPSGAPSFEFESTVAGNRKTQKVKIVNDGYKEAIVRQINVRDGSGNKLAACIETDDTYLSCRNPDDLSQTLALNEFPFLISDTSNCLDLHSKMNYTRLPDGTLSDDLISVSGKPDMENNGDYCIFDITFQPSLQFIDSGTLENIRLSFEYDSTWKNNIDIRNDAAQTSYQYSIDKAPYLSIAQVSVKDADYYDLTHALTYDAGNDTSVLNLGRIALITQSKYGQKLKLNFANRGGVAATLVDFVDGAGNPITDISYDLTPYYRTTSQSCQMIDSSGGVCSLSTTLTPLSNDNGTPYTETERKNMMFDVLGPLNYKHFKVRYLDGATFNDDLTPRDPQVIDVWLTAFLIEKGLLTFIDANQGNFQGVINENTKYKHIILENIGTGTVPYITLDPSSPYELTCATAKTNNQSCNIEVVDSATAMGGADFDCYDVMYINNILDLSPSPSYIPPALVKPGLGSAQTCSLTVRAKLRDNDVVVKSQYDAGQWVEEDRDFDSDWLLSGETEKFWEKRANQQEGQFSIMYVDGDSGADPANGYFPQITGLGNIHRILGGISGYMDVKVNFKTYGRVVPETPWPYYSSIIFRRPVFLINDAVPDLAKGEWGNPVSFGGVIPDVYYSEALDAVGYLSSISGDLVNDFMNNIAGLSANEDYQFFAGAYPQTGETFTFRHRLCNKGNSDLTFVNFMLAGEDAVLRLKSTNNSAAMNNYKLGTGSCKDMYYDFTPDSPNTTYQYDLDMQYTNGVVNDAGTPIVSEKRIQVIVDSINSMVPVASVEEEKIVVEYDQGTSTAIETLTGVRSPVPTEYSTVPVVSGSRLKAIKGSNIYAKRRYHLTNTGADPMNSIYIARVNSHLDTSDLSNNVEMQIVNDLCSGQSLLQNQSCTYEVKYSPGIAAAILRDFAIAIRYQVGSQSGIPRYIARYYRTTFEATEPALFDMKFVNPVNLSIMVQNAYGIDMGDFYNTHIILRDYPRTAKLEKDIEINNPNAEKGSFLAQYREFIGNSTAHPPNHEDPVKIFDDGKKEVYVGRKCLYGDDEYDDTIPYEKKGISSNSASTCLMRAVFYASVDDMAKDLVPLNTAVPLKFYNNERASVDTFYIYFTGFIEPNQCNAPPGAPIYDVYTDDAGTARFKLNPFTEDNLQWGAITKYRVFYSRLDSVLQNIFTAVGAASVDVPVSGTMQFEVNNLKNGTYYYFLPVAVRTTPTGEEFLSRSGLSPQKLLIPPPGTFWDAPTNLVIDKYRSPIASPVFTTKADADYLCTLESAQIDDKGQSIRLSKQLLNSQVADIIAPLGLDGSDYYFDYMPHWTSDPPVDIAPIFGASYNPATTTGNNPEVTMFYMKPCYDDGCRFLSKIVGGDGEDIPPAAVIYVEGDAMNAAVRCFTDLN